MCSQSSRRAPPVVEPRTDYAYTFVHTQDQLFLRTARHPGHVCDGRNPVTDAELEAKYFDLTVPTIGRAAAVRLLAQLWRLENLAGAGACLDALQARPARAAAGEAASCAGSGVARQ